MQTLREMYDDYWDKHLSLRANSSQELLAAGEAVTAMLDKHFPDIQTHNEVCHSINEQSYAQGAEGFIHGFRYAVKLMNDCNS